MTSLQRLIRIATTAGIVISFVMTAGPFKTAYATQHQPFPSRFQQSLIGPARKPVSEGNSGHRFGSTGAVSNKQALLAWRPGPRGLYSSPITGLARGE